MIFRLVLPVLLFTSSLLSGSTKSENAPPNIVIILTDEERFLPPNEEGNPEIQKFFESQLPARTRLMRTGLRFRQHYIASSACSPSRASLFTGHYPPVHGLDQTFLAAKTATDPSVKWLKPGEMPTMGDIFRASGYRTVYKGKWHISHEVLADENGLPVQTVSKNGQPILENENLYLEANLLDKFGFEGWIGPEPHALEEQYLGRSTDPNYARQAADWIRRYDESGAKKPFLLVTSLVNPHDICFFMATCARRQTLRDSTVPTIPVSPSLHDTLAHKPTVQKRYRDIQKLMALPFPGLWDYFYQDQEKLLGYYYYLMKKVDSDMDLVLKSISKSSFKENTIILWTSDHGDVLGAHGGIQQKWHNAYQEVVHVPMVLAGNPVDKIRNKSVVTELSNHVDIIPTLAGIAGIDLEQLQKQLIRTHSRVIWPLPGSDLSPLFKKKDLNNNESESGVYFRTDDEITVGPFRTPMLYRFYLPTVLYPWLSVYPEVRGASHIETLIQRIDGSLYKLSRYFDPRGIVEDQWEWYHLNRDPYELINLRPDDQVFPKLKKLLEYKRKVNVERYLQAPDYSPRSKL